MRAVASLPFVTDDLAGPLGHDLAEPGRVVQPNGPSVDAVVAIRAVLRALEPGAGEEVILATDAGVVLERLSRPTDPPAVSSCTPLEPSASRRPVSAAPTVRAFLDGIQRSRLIGHVAGSPLVLGTVAAGVRVRDARRLVSWRAPVVRRTLFASRAQIGERIWSRLSAAGVPLVDLTDREAADAISPHPLAIRARALELVAREREQAERQLAAEWCASETTWLWIDGGIAGNLAVNEQATAFGVVKSHNTLYGDADFVRQVFALRAGERSPSFLVGHRSRRAVASWYLRLRDSTNGDPLHGLVRVEVAPPLLPLDVIPHGGDADLSMYVARIDAISSWILAERAPVSLPDPRWDTLTYGVYACEQYLHAIIGP